MDVHAPGVQVLSEVSTSDTAIQVRQLWELMGVQLESQKLCSVWAGTLTTLFYSQPARALQAEQDGNFHGNTARGRRGGPLFGAAPGG